MISQHIRISASLFRNISVALIFLISGRSNAQVAEMWLDTTTIRIGDPVALTIDLKFTEETKVDSLYWPVFSDTLSTAVEILDKTSVDTLRNNPANEFEFSLRQILTVTCWDSGYHVIPPVKFLVLGDTVQTHSLEIHVVSPEVDSEAEFKDIAGIYDIEMSWAEWLKKYWYIQLSAIVLLAGIFLLVRKLRKKPAAIVAEQMEEVRLSAAEKALARLHVLHDARMWQQGMVKEYYSDLTEITREYLENKFGIRCLEATTSEILRSMKNNPETAEYVPSVRQVLDLGDMAKFAKQKPIALDNERAFQLAIELVNLSSHSNHTKQE